jgi:hypothetical protein
MELLYPLVLFIYLFLKFKFVVIILKIKKFGDRRRCHCKVDLTCFFLSFFPNSSKVMTNFWAQSKSGNISSKPKFLFLSLFNDFFAEKDEHLRQDILI